MKLSEHGLLTLHVEKYTKTILQIIKLILLLPIYSTFAIC
jgi:hypothetical protein